jgi:small GTP-binding protein domain
MGDEEYDYLFKCVIIGDSGVGKSNIFNRFIRDEFNLDSKATIGVEFSAKNVTVQDKVIKCQVWDTAGQERFRALAKSYYRGAVGCLLVYDITNYDSFQHLDKWLKEVKDHAEPHLVVLLIGNKCDLEEKRAVKQEEGAEFAEKNGLGFIEVSAKDNLNIETAFSRLTTEIFNVLDQVNESEPDNNGSNKSPTKGGIIASGGGQTIQITNNNASAKKEKSGCC